MALCWSCHILAAEKIVVATAIWQNYSDADGSGLYNALLADVYGDEYELEFIYADYVRSKALVKSGKADLWLAAYKDEENYAIYPNNAMDADFVHVMQLLPDNRTAADYKGEIAAWFKGYHYHKYFADLHLKGVEVDNITTAVKLLKAGKVELILGDDSELQDALRAAGIGQEEFKFEKFATLWIYPAFAPGTLGEQLRQKWDERMSMLLKQGRVRQLYQKHNVLDAFPF